MLQPILRKSWSPKGKTPIHYQWGRHDKISVISALTASPRRKQVKLFFSIHSSNITAKDVSGFLSRLNKSIRNKKIIILDRWSVHKSGILRKFFRKNAKRIKVIWLPGYAPQFNPVERVWSHSKYADLANFAPNDKEELRQSVNGSLSKTKTNQQLLRSFFYEAGLPLGKR